MKVTEKQLTKAELSYAEELPLTEKQLQFLFAKTPAKYTQTRKGKGVKDFTYVSIGYVTKVLNLMFGWQWSSEIVDKQYDLEIAQCWVHVRLKIDLPTGIIIKEQFGTKDITFFKGTQKPVSLGNDLKAAASDGLKKCASQIGIAGDIYYREEFTPIKVKQADSDSDKLLRYINQSTTIQELDHCVEQFIQAGNDMTPELEEHYDKKLLSLNQ